MGRGPRVCEGWYEEPGTRSACSGFGLVAVTGGRAHCCLKAFPVTWRSFILSCFVFLAERLCQMLVVNSQQMSRAVADSGGSAELMAIRSSGRNYDRDVTFTSLKSDSSDERAEHGMQEGENWDRI